MRNSTRTAAILAASATATTTWVVAMTSTAGGTPASAGATTSVLNRATLDERVHVNFHGVEIKNQDPIDLLQLQTVAPAGWSSGWHEHVGPVYVSIKRGTLTVVRPDCRPTTYSAGDVFVEQPGQPLIARVGAGEAEWFTTMLITPVAGPSRVDSSGLCGLL